MIIIAENDHSKLIKFSNGKLRLSVFNNLSTEMQGVKSISCTVSNNELECCTFNGKLDLQYMVQSKRSNLK